MASIDFNEWSAMEHVQCVDKFSVVRSLLKVAFRADAE